MSSGGYRGQPGLAARRPDVAAPPGRALNARQALFAGLFVFPFVATYAFMTSGQGGALDALLVFGSTGVATALVVRDLAHWTARRPTVTLPGLDVLFTLGTYLFLFVGAVPAFVDPTFLEFRGGQAYAPRAMAYVAGCMLLYRLGCGLLPRGPTRVGLEAFRRADVSPTMRRAVQALLWALVVVVWGIRLRQASTGNFSEWSTFRSEVSVGERSLYYFVIVVQWVIIPTAEYLRATSSRRMWGIVFGAVAWMEVGAHVLENSRTRVFLAIALLGLIRANFGQKTWKWLALRTLAVVAAFLLVVNPAFILMRDVLQERSGKETSLGTYGALYLEASARTVTGGPEGKYEATLERDTKYRMNALYYISSLMLGADRWGADFGWGMYTVRNLAAVVPTVLWEGKHDFAVGVMKTKVPRDFHIPVRDYLQSLYAHFFTDFGWLGIVAFFFIGMFDGFVTGRLQGATARLTCTLWLACLAPVWFHPVTDAADHLVYPFRETLFVFGALLLLEQRLLSEKVGKLFRGSPGGSIAGRLPTVARAGEGGGVGRGL